MDGWMKWIEVAAADASFTSNVSFPPLKQLPMGPLFFNLLTGLNQITKPFLHSLTLKFGSWSNSLTDEASEAI